jgi:hypothetical protein
VELAVIQEYLAAAFSLNLGAGAPASELRHDVQAAHAELMRVVVGEMRHLRLVNDVLFALTRGKRAYAPALRVAAKVPSKNDGGYRARAERRLTREVLDEFLNIERPSLAVDGLYARILATLERDAPEPLQASVRSIMSDGADHYMTFGFIKEWLTRHDETEYLRPLERPKKTHPDHRRLQRAYKGLLQTFERAYAVGMPAGAAILNEARALMVDEIQQVCGKLSEKRLLVTFEDLGAPFHPIQPPRA